MSDPIEERLRAHFADRAANEPLPAGGDAAPRMPAEQPAGRHWFWVAAAAAAVVAFVGTALVVADEDDDAADIVGTEDSTTTTDGAQRESTTTTTEAQGTTTSTTTAAAPVPSGAAGDNGVRSVVVTPQGIAGWWTGSQWVVQNPDLAIPLAGGERYTVLGVGRPSSDVTGSEPREECAIEFGGTTGVDVGLVYPDDRLEPWPIAVTGVADPEPRPITTMDRGSETYRQAAVDALASIDVVDPEPEIVQLLRADLEGDGVDEVLFVVERLTDPETLFAAEGDYSVLFVRKVVDDQVRTLVVSQSLARPETADETPFVQISRVAAVADLNGDGVMEVVVANRYYEGVATGVYSIAADVTRVLAIGCGV